MTVTGLQEARLRIDVKRMDGSVVMEWTGTSDALEPAPILGPFLDQLADESVGSALTIDLRGLRFMNSATVGPILRFLRRLNRLKVQTKILYGAGAQWQRVHFSSMRVIARSLPHIKVELS